MSGDEDRDSLSDLVAEARIAERLRSMAEYAELRNRWLMGNDRPGDRQRRAVLRAILKRTGGIPNELTWPWYR